MCVCMCVYVCMYVCVYVCIYVCNVSIYCLYIGFDYIYIDLITLAQGIKLFLAGPVWCQMVAGA